MSENGNLKILREGAPLHLLGGAGAQIHEPGTPRTCWPGRWTDPHKKTENERHTTQHAGEVGRAAQWQSEPPAGAWMALSGLRGATEVITDLDALEA